MGSPFTEQERSWASLLSLLSSALFSVGSTFLACYIFAVSATDGGQDLMEAKAPKIMILLGYSTLAAHTFPEIILDYSASRIFDHSRYGKDSPMLNAVNSVLFLIGSTTQCLAFLAYLSEDMENSNLYVALNLFASVLWIGSAVATSMSRGCFVFRCGPCPDTFDQIANGVYVLSTGLLGVAALNVYDDSNQAFLGNFLQELVFLMWAVIGVLYLAADIQRFRELPAQSSVDSRPLVPNEEDSKGVEMNKDPDIVRVASV
jgi:hypothetical protein